LQDLNEINNYFQKVNPVDRVYRLVDSARSRFAVAQLRGLLRALASGRLWPWGLTAATTKGKRRPCRSSPIAADDDGMDEMAQ
jgi:hypothetical protein